jgi:hypothetical protein
MGSQTIPAFATIATKPEDSARSRLRNLKAHDRQPMPHARGPVIIEHLDQPYHPDSGCTCPVRDLRGEAPRTSHEDIPRLHAAPG